MKTKYHFIFFIFIFLLSSCNLSDPVPIDGKVEFKLTQDSKIVINSNNKFGLKLFREINAKDKGKNIFISPLSVSFALSMALNGANGTTYTEMQSMLEQNGMEIAGINNSFKLIMDIFTNLDPVVAVKIANSVWYRNGFIVESAFIEQCKKYFYSEVMGKDFNDPATITTINNWVNTTTNGKIQKLFEEPISENVVMFLINAIYFKGDWTKKFDVNKTFTDKFINGNIKTDCKMMTQKGKYYYYENSDFKMVDLPYGKNGFSMTVFLPLNMDSFLESFTESNWNQWLGSMKKDSGEIFLPRFKSEYEISLRDILNSMGMVTAFTVNADFTNINKLEKIFVSEVKHKTFVEVNEEGTEAAAVTAVEFTNTAFFPDYFTFYANKPFVYVIRENQSQTILFAGKMLTPGI